MNALEELIKNVLETRYENIPKDVIERVKDGVSDTLGCAVGGANGLGSPMIVDLVKEWGGAPESTILAYGIKAPSHMVAMANSIMARSFDYGMVDMWVDGLIRAAHITETMVPTALAIAEQKGMSGKDLLTAVVVGEDITSRLMATPNKHVLYWDQTGTLNTFGAAAVAGRLLGLTPRQMYYAFGIALNHMGGTCQGLVDKSSCWKINQGLSAQKGIFAARLAGKGYVGLKDPLFAANGYFALYDPDYNPAVLTKDLGKKFWTQISIKPYPQCRGTHSSTESAMKIVDKYHIDPNNIAEVNVIVHTNSVPASLRDPFVYGEVPPVTGHFSLQYTVANALLRGLPVPQHFTEEAVRDPKVAELMKKIKMTTQDYPGESFLAATVKVKMKDGKEYSEHVNAPKGNELENPLTREEKRAKFRNNIKFSGKVDPKNADKALAMMEKLEDVKDITQIIKLMVA